jgi:hypothetical protein
MVSVWEHPVISVDEARAFRTQQVVAIPYWLLVGAIEGVDARHAVVADPLDDPRAGAHAHCGICGLERASKENKRDHNARLDRIAELCSKQPVNDGSR